uniref:Uncharacterized protein n=2 Tax=Sphaerodactylus townsendi TaxID=933632 RepID=A0ACB8EW36_9SAUR
MLLLPPRGSTHCELFPKSICEQHTAFVPGYNLTGEGIDVTTMQRKGTYLVDTNRWLDPQDTCVLCRNPLMDNQLQRLPLAGMDWRAHPSCHRQASSSVEHSDVDVAKVLAEEVKNNWIMKFSLPKEMQSVAKDQVVLVGSRSEMVSYAHEKSQKDRYSFVRHEVSCEHYRLSLLPRPSLLSPHFSHDVLNLPSKYDPDEYQHFIDTYGTHYISHAQLGGRVRSLLAVRTCAANLAGITASDIKDCLSLGASLGPEWMSHSLSSKCHEVRRNQAKGVFREAYGKQRIEVVGGSTQAELFAEPGEILLFSEWMENIKTHPGVISYSLLPVHTLVDRGDPRREILKEAVRDYIAQKALWKNCTNQCPDGSYPTSKNPCQCLCRPDAFTDTTCCPRERGLAHLLVHIQRASGLPGKFFYGSDAYVKVFFQGHERRTIVIPHNNDPVWTQNLDFGPVKLTGHNPIMVEVWDSMHWGHHKHLATCYEDLVAGGTVWKTCNVGKGHMVYYYVLKCGPNLGGPSCHDYVPQKQR